MAIEKSVNKDEFINALTGKLQRLDRIFDDFADTAAWLATLDDPGLAAYFGGDISVQDANDIKSIVGVVNAAGTAFASHANIDLVRKAFGPGVIQR